MKLKEYVLTLFISIMVVYLGAKSLYFGVCIFVKF